MLNKAIAVQEVLRCLRKMETSDSLELLTWKKDRSLLLVRQSEENPT